MVSGSPGTRPKLSGFDDTATMASCLKQFVPGCSVTRQTRFPWLSSNSSDESSFPSARASKRTNRRGSGASLRLRSSEADPVTSYVRLQPTRTVMSRSGGVLLASILMRETIQPAADATASHLQLKGTEESGRANYQHDGRHRLQGRMSSRQRAWLLHEGEDCAQPYPTLRANPGVEAMKSARSAMRNVRYRSTTGSHTQLADFPRRRVAPGFSEAPSREGMEP